MHFDDMLATVLAQPATDAVARQISWRQLVDILAQDRGASDARVRAEALTWLEHTRGEIAPVVRSSVARALALRVTAPDLVAYFAKDDPAIAAPMLRQASLSADQWRDIIPIMPAASRALLRERRDLPQGVTRALGSYGRADFALEAPERVARTAAKNKTAPKANETSFGPTDSMTPIAAIVARIEAFRARRAVVAVSSSPNQADQFTFETDCDGVINFVSSVPREAVYGISIATAGEGWLCGVDGHAAGAFRAHSAFRGARLMITGKSSAAGDWVIDGDPMFDPQHGTFLGYHGTAHRPHGHERAEHVLRSDVSPQNNDQLRQLVHELRTPLNAIQGFAEMIDKQLLGPISAEYRARARDIMHEGGRLLSAIEDVDTAARLDTHALDINTHTVTDAAALLSRIGTEFVSFTDQRHIHLRIARGAVSMPVSVDRPTLHRLFSRLIGAMIGIADAGETLDAALAHGATHMSFSINRPHALMGRTEHELRDPNYTLDGDWPDAPLLGLGFALRLIDRLASAAHVKFRIEDTRFVLILPAAQDSADAERGAVPEYGDERTAIRPPTAE